MPLENKQASPQGHKTRTLQIPFNTPHGIDSPLRNENATVVGTLIYIFIPATVRQPLSLLSRALPLGREFVHPGYHPPSVGGPDIVAVRVDFQDGGRLVALVHQLEGSRLQSCRDLP